MPRVCQFMLRTALAWMLIGYTAGALLLLNKAVPFFAPIWTLRTSHVAILLFGWLVQLSMAVMVWIMPRVVTTSDRGNLLPLWLTYGALNAGVILVILQPALAFWVSASYTRWMGPIAGVSLLLAVVVFMAHIWRRVRPVALPEVSARRGLS
jgi:hypothetical protein